MSNVEHRLEQLEHDNERIVHVLFGNGQIGIDERVRHIEKVQAENVESLRRVESYVLDMQLKANRALGGWTAIKWMLGVGLPALIAVLWRIMDVVARLPIDP